MRVFNTSIDFADNINGEQWSFERVKLEYAKADDLGERGELRGVLQSKKHARGIPVEASFIHEPKDIFALARFQVAQSDLALFSGYIPLHLRNIFNATGQVELKVKLEEGGIIYPPAFRAYFGQGYFFPEMAYTFPISFQSFEVEGLYKPEEDHTLTIRRFSMVDDENSRYTGHGVVTNLGKGEKPYLDLEVRFNQAKADQLIRYLPDKIISKPVNWLQNHIHHAVIKNGYLKFNASTENMKDCREKCGWDARGKFSELNMSFLDKATPLTQGAGLFKMTPDSIHVALNNGRLANQKVRDVSATIAPLFHEGEDTYYTSSGRMLGDVSEALQEVKKTFNPKEELPHVKGEHTSFVKLRFPFRQNLEDYIEYEVNSDIAGLTATVEVGEEAYTFTSDLAALKIKNNHLTFQGEGEINNISAKLFVQDKIQPPGPHTRIKLTSRFMAGQLPSTYIPQQVSLTGSLEAVVQLREMNENEYDVDVTADMRATTLRVLPMAWQKESGQQAKFSAKGRVNREKAGVVNIEHFMFTAEDAEVMGSLYFNPETKKLSTQLSPMKIGRTNVTFSLKDNFYTINGESLDLSGMNFFSAKENIEEQSSQYMVDVKKVYTKNSWLDDVQVQGRVEKGEIEELTINANPEGTGSANIKILKQGPIQTVNGQSTNAGAVLRAYGVYQNIKGGELDVDIKYDLSQEQREGTGDIKITNFRMVDAPIMARLLSVLSLEQILTPGEGIIFDSLEAPLLIDGDLYKVYKARLTGPSIGLRAKGSVDVAKSTMHIKGSLIPVEGLNTIIDRIPLVGSILTGSQEGLVVADFTIKGKVKNPSVFVNPLSVVTPGLIKDIFGGLVGSKDDIPLPPEDISATQPKTQVIEDDD